MPTRISNHPCWEAISNHDLESLRSLLANEPELASRDFRAPEDQDPHTFGYPIVKAASMGNLAIIDLLLNHGADINARSPFEDQREFGAPLMHALEQEHYHVVHFLLDRGASVDAYGYCYPSMVDLLYKASCECGAPVELARPGLNAYLGAKEDAHTAGRNEDSLAEEVKLFRRVIALGGQPSMRALVCQQYDSAIRELLQTCPDQPGTKFDHPPGTVLETLCRAAAWHGFPEVLNTARRLCAERYDLDLSLDALHRAIISHNREGLASEFLKLIRNELVFLQNNGWLAAVLEGNQFLPHFLLAQNYLWPNWYGNEQDPSTPESMIELSEVFSKFGFKNFHQPDPSSGKTPLEIALDRKQHPGVDAYISYLRSQH